MAADEIERLRSYRQAIPRTAAGAAVRRDTDARLRAAMGAALPRTHGHRKVKRGARG